MCMSQIIRICNHTWLSFCTYISWSKVSTDYNTYFHNVFLIGIGRNWYHFSVFICDREKNWCWTTQCRNSVSVLFFFIFISKDRLILSHSMYTILSKCSQCAKFFFMTKRIQQKSTPPDWLLVFHFNIPSKSHASQIMCITLGQGRLY